MIYIHIYNSSSKFDVVLFLLFPSLTQHPPKPTNEHLLLSSTNTHSYCEVFWLLQSKLSLQQDLQWWLFGICYRLKWPLFILLYLCELSLYDNNIFLLKLVKAIILLSKTNGYNEWRLYVLDISSWFNVSGVGLKLL